MWGTSKSLIITELLDQGERKTQLQCRWQGNLEQDFWSGLSIH